MKSKQIFEIYKNLLLTDYEKAINEIICRLIRYVLFNAESLDLVDVEARINIGKALNTCSKTYSKIKTLARKEGLNPSKETFIKILKLRFKVLYFIYNCYRFNDDNEKRRLKGERMIHSYDPIYELHIYHSISEAQNELDVLVEFLSKHFSKSTDW